MVNRIIDTKVETKIISCGCFQNDKVFSAVLVQFYISEFEIYYEQDKIYLHITISKCQKIRTKFNGIIPIFI